MASCSQPPPPPPDPAIRSHPPHIELVKMLVDPSVSPPGNIIIHEADVYGQDPADLTRHLAATVAVDGQKAWYFSTKLEPKSQRGKRKRRCMESGVWHDEGKSKPVGGGSDGGAIIGHRSLFSFVNKVGGKKDARTGWIMHEFRLPDGNEDESQLVVLCKVFRSSRRCATAEAQAQVEAEEEEALVKETVDKLALREEELAEREAAVEAAREALARREAADLAVSERSLQTMSEEQEQAMLLPEWMARLPASPVALQAILETMRDLRAGLLTRDLRMSQPIFEAMMRVSLALAPLLAAALAREPEVREAEGEGMARRDAARLAASERNLQERERDLSPWEQTRLQAIYEELEAELEAALVLILMAAAALVSRAGLLMLLPIALVAPELQLLPIVVEHWSLSSETVICTRRRRK